MDEESKNRDFVQVYRNYIDSIAELASQNSTAYKLFMLLIKHMDGNNALCVSVKTLSEILEVSTKTVTRAANYLKKHGWVCVLKSGTTNVYIINPDIAWTSYANQKQYCKFQANVLVSRTENANYLKNPNATNHFKTIDSEFVQHTTNKSTKFKKQYDNHKQSDEIQKGEDV